MAKKPKAKINKNNVLGSIRETKAQKDEGDRILNEIVRVLATPLPGFPFLEEWQLVNGYNAALFEAKHPSELPAVAMPDEMRHLDQYKGFPVGFMFSFDEEKRVPDFKELDLFALDRCEKLRLCGLCGEPLGNTFVVVGGPLTSKNRTSSDPPFHRDCARYALQICPFLLGQTDYSKETQNMEKAGLLAPWAQTQDRAPEIQGLFHATTYARFAPDGRYKVFFFSPWLKVEWFRRSKRRAPNGG